MISKPFPSHSKQGSQASELSNRDNTEETWCPGLPQWKSLWHRHQSFFQRHKVGHLQLEEGASQLLHLLCLLSPFLLKSEVVLEATSRMSRMPLYCCNAPQQPSRAQLHISLHVSSGQAASTAACRHSHPYVLLSGTIIFVLNHQPLLGGLHLMQ